MSLGATFVERILEITDFGLPGRRGRQLLIGILVGSALLFPVTFKAGLTTYIEERACSIENALVRNLVLNGEKGEVVKSNGVCTVRFAPIGGAHEKPELSGDTR